MLSVAADQHHEPVESERDAAMRRRAEAENACSKWPNIVCLLLRLTPSTSKIFACKSALVDADRAAAEFHAVQHHVVSLGAHLFVILRFEQRHVFGLRRVNG